MVDLITALDQEVEAVSGAGEMRLPDASGPFRNTFSWEVRTEESVYHPLVAWAAALVFPCGDPIRGRHACTPSRATRQPLCDASCHEGLEQAVWVAPVVAQARESSVKGFAVSCGDACGRESFEGSRDNALGKPRCAGCRDPPS